MGRQISAPLLWIPWPRVVRPRRQDSARAPPITLTEHLGRFLIRARFNLPCALRGKTSEGGVARVTPLNLIRGIGPSYECHPARVSQGHGLLCDGCYRHYSRL